MWVLAENRFLPYYDWKVYKKKSAVFHAQIRQKYHEYQIKNVAITQVFHIIEKNRFECHLMRKLSLNLITC